MLLQVLQSIPLMLTTKHSPLSLPNPSKKHDLVRLLPTTEPAVPYHTTHGFPPLALLFSSYLNITFRVYRGSLLGGIKWLVHDIYHLPQIVLKLMLSAPIVLFFLHDFMTWTQKMLHYIFKTYLQLYAHIQYKPASSVLSHSARATGTGKRGAGNTHDVN